MNVNILYGRSGLKVDIPDDTQVDVIRKHQMPLVKEPAASVSNAFNNPIGCPSLAELASRANSACILLCDVTRPVPNALFIDPLIQTLVENGIDSDQITVLIATGLHRPNENEELAEVVGSQNVFHNFNVVNHFATIEEDHVELGETTRETVIKIDRRFVQADLKIATGLVEPHFMAGYSGGRKVITPGIAHADTIRRLHSAHILEDPATRSCNLENNPLHAEQLEVLDMLRQQTNSEIYAINTVIDEYRRLGLFNFGEIEQSHLEAVAFAHKYTSVDISRKYQNILTSAGGYPLDQTYYQTVKGMVTPLEIAEKEANLIVASECAEGIGSDSFRSAQVNLIAQGKERFLEDLKRKSLADIDEWESEMQVRAQSVARVQLYAPSLTLGDQSLTGVELIDSIEDTIRENLASSRDKHLAIIPEGPYVIPNFIN